MDTNGSDVDGDDDGVACEGDGVGDLNASPPDTIGDCRPDGEADGEEPSDGDELKDGYGVNDGYGTTDGY